MKRILTLTTVLLSNLLVFSQTDPSSSPGYDQQKSSLIQPAPQIGLSLITDSTNYQPGSTATITGSGFQAGESVSVKVQSAFGNPTCNHPAWNVVANGSGNIVTTWPVCTGNCTGNVLSANANSSSGSVSARFTNSLATTSCFFSGDSSYTELTRNDDGSSALIALPFTFNLYGTNYNHVYINNNGNLTFTGPIPDFSAEGFPFGTPMVAPFWADIDTRNPLSGVVKYKVTPTYMIVTWEAVGYYNQHADKLNTFQVIISDGIDSIIGNGNNVAFYYGDMEWTTGDASGGTGGFFGTPATVGINKGNDTDYVQVGRFNRNSSAFAGGISDSNGVNYLDNQCFFFDVTNAGNQPPSVNGLPGDNTIDIVCGEDQTIALTFLPPEVFQSVITTVDTTGLCGATISITNGAVSTAAVTITGSACNLGTHVIKFTAIDDFSVPDTTEVTITVNVLPFEVNISTNSPVCEGDSLQLSADNGDGFSWTGPDSFASGDQNPAVANVTAANAGSYSVVATTSSGCSASASANVIINQAVFPEIRVSSLLYDCPDDSVFLTAADTSGIPYNSYSYLWSTSETTQEIVITTPGTYSVTISTPDGCAATTDN